MACVELMAAFWTFSGWQSFSSLKLISRAGFCLTAHCCLIPEVLNTVFFIQSITNIIFTDRKKLNRENVSFLNFAPRNHLMFRACYQRQQVNIFLLDEAVFFKIPQTQVFLGLLVHPNAQSTFGIRFYTEYLIIKEDSMSNTVPTFGDRFTFGTFQVQIPLCAHILVLHRLLDS